MPNPSTTTGSTNLMNVPNQVTISRIFLSIVLFVFLSLGWYLTSMVLFVLTAITDWVDGYWARKYEQITQLGRVLDPFADKLFICGTFVFLAAVPDLANGITPSGITAWMAVVIIGRELLVTALRTFVEQEGGDFSAKWVGKWKMVLQCLAAGWSIVHLSYVNDAQNAWQTAPPSWMSQGLVYVVWGALLLTLYSGWVYIQASLVAFRQSK
ncbi:MAG: CDP-diacylglycerol--glycerol-3-phosphate 3-phosphatidyltransferase [Planctomycetaceae bacterium]|nr:CDP-diacylglycerol--glycerol-3-phosphate 3-phosphatidyltransferase [Planctomycetaceae bacterium]